jgi:hypothetical protein
MATESHSPVKDPHYDLIAILEASLEMVWQVDTYIQDAEAAGDAELAEWFRKIQTNNRKAGEQGKQMLLQRLQNEGN